MGGDRRSQRWWATDRQQTCIEVEKFLAAFISVNGYSPSYQQICDGTGIRSKSTVQSVLDDLKRQGRITRDHGVARSIRMVKKK